MKTSAILFYLLIICSFSKSQITDDYPFKTYLDSMNNLYTVGYIVSNGQKDIYIQKFNSSGGQYWDKQILNSFGDDRGLDLAIDLESNIFVTGYTFNSESNSNDIIVISLTHDGIIRWIKILRNPGDDKGIGIGINVDNFGIATEVFISGYVTTPRFYKDFIIKKYSASDGDSLGQNIYGLKFGDDIATDILLDGNYAYLLGYAYFGPQRMNDIALLTFWQSDLSLNEVLFDNRPGSDEKPTGFVLAEKSSVPVQKSKISLTSVSDLSAGGGGISFLTLFLNPTVNNTFNIKWTSKFVSCSACKNDAVTSIAEDYTGDIYVAGYIDRSFIRNRGYDFATIKYKSADGTYGWQEGVNYFNYSDSSTRGINDKASSIKINNQKTVYVAGVSEASPSGFSYVQYSQTAGDPVYELDRVFTPNFITDDRTGGANMNKWATMHLANDGTPLMVVMGWNETNAYWAAIRYDANGNVLYTINDDTVDMNRVPANNNEKTLSLTNYPNPFNPSTVISYSLIENGFVSLKVYNALGKEVASLVNEKQISGNHSAIFNAGNLSSGVYYYTMTVNGTRNQTKRMLLLK